MGDLRQNFGKGHGKRLKLNLLHYLYNHDQKYVSGPELQKHIGTSRHLFYYHINKLIDSGFVKKSFQDSVNFYQITFHGKSWYGKSFSWGMRAPILGLHNIAFKFKIVGGKPFHFSKTVSMRNWSYSHASFTTCHVRKTNNYLIVTPIPKNNRLTGHDAFQLKQKARDMAIDIAHKIAERYNLTLSEPVQSRREHFGVQDPVAKYIKPEITTKTAKIDDSENNGGEIDFLNPQSAKDYLDMPGRVRNLENILTQLLENQKVYSEHLNAHIPVLVGMDRLMRKLNRILSQRKVTEYI